MTLLDTKASYTYSKDFFSATIAPVNPDEVWAEEEAKSKERWITKRGLVWPAPKEPAEYNKHAKAPSAARQDDLNEQWVEGGALGTSTGIDRGSLEDPALMTPYGFNTTPVKTGSTVFGLVDPKTGKQSSTYFKSVHLVGEGLAKEKADEKKRALQEWKDKLVVDNARFMPHFTQKHPNQVDRYTGLLKGKPMKKSFKRTMRAKLPSGKKVVLKDMPVSMYRDDPYAPPADFTSTMRQDDPTLRISKEKFICAIHKDKMQPKLNTVLARRDVPPLRPEERKGILWGKPRKSASTSACCWNGWHVNR